jgi:hypothetical protein
VQGTRFRVQGRERRIITVQRKEQENTWIPAGVYPERSRKAGMAKKMAGTVARPTRFLTESTKKTEKSMLRGLCERQALNKEIEINKKNA